MGQLSNSRFFFNIIEKLSFYEGYVSNLIFAGHMKLLSLEMLSEACFEYIIFSSKYSSRGNTFFYSSSYSQLVLLRVASSICSNTKPGNFASALQKKLNV